MDLFREQIFFLSRVMRVRRCFGKLESYVYGPMITIIITTIFSLDHKTYDEHNCQESYAKVVLLALSLWCIRLFDRMCVFQCVPCAIRLYLLRGVKTPM